MRLSLLMRGSEALGFSGNPDGEVASICYDSRQCGQGSLFVAISGLKEDGHTFIADALARGARFIIHEREFLPPAGVTAVRVRDSRRCLGVLGKNFFGDPSAALRLIAIVGTNGKTTVTYLLESILRAAGHNVGVLGTINYRFGGNSFPAPNTTPESFEMQRILREMTNHGVTHCVAEVSSHAIDLRRVDDCAFDLGVFTNLTQDHLDYHGTMETYYQAKKRFFSEVLPTGGKSHRHKTIVNNESSEIIRILNLAFNAFTNVHTDYYPENLRSEIDKINDLVYPNINNGVYRAGFATAQAAYEQAFRGIFDTLDDLEQRLSQHRYLTGNTITEADWRLFCTLIRFDAVYYAHFKCNWRHIYEYPNLSNYVRDLYQVPGVAETVSLQQIKRHYYGSQRQVNPTGIVPVGPQLDFSAPHDRARFG